MTLLVPLREVAFATSALAVLEVTTMMLQNCPLYVMWRSV